MLSSFKLYFIQFKEVKFDESRERDMVAGNWGPDNPNTLLNTDIQLFLGSELLFYV